MKPVWMLAFVTLAAAPMPAFAQDSAMKADARCAIALQGMSSQVPEDTKAAVQSLMMYYVGKMVGRSNPTTAGAALKTAENELKPSDYQSVVMGCTKEVEEVGTLFQGL
ncbi:hypothetical protein P1X14_14650 [Sphingomonas sp. AOB5]|uniref:hypothetical protein n=1 Tax=Sphingomonas sp. AOB5 TaxID=3034017 RepID=UPI0023F62430|nr:hypothetical protein [Sphingomonas sp. AOB5]MDF7776492.1 hypothetical protein [Sphingomonas sp. AOB5]